MTTATSPTPIPLQHPAEETAPADSERAQDEQAERAKNYSFTLPPSLMARTRSAQWHTNSQPDGHQTVSAMVRTLIRAEVERLEKEYNRGRPWPPVEGRLPSGPGPEGAVRGAQIRARNRQRKEQQQPGTGDGA
ncbi:ParB family protein [Streptomyces kronopolitis]|uniref:ParB family protein n=1 Tax=Streptomyces kronopolitis TaxID=1612435 RepID=UPI003D97FA21